MSQGTEKVLGVIVNILQLVGGLALAGLVLLALEGWLFGLRRR